MRKIRRLPTFVIELLQFESRKTSEIDCFDALPYPLKFLLLLNFVIFMNELVSRNKGSLHAEDQDICSISL